MIKKIKKVRRVAVICAVALMLGLTGCGKESDKKEESSINQQEIEESSVGGNETKTVDSVSEIIEQVFNNIEVDGKHVDFPFSLNDLGDEYEFANYVDMGDGRYIMDLIFNGENIAGVCVFAKSKEEIDRNSNITEINITGSNKQVITINSIDCNSTVEDVEKNLDKLPFYYDENKLVTSIEYSDNVYGFYLHIDEGKKITGIYMDKNGE